MGNLSAHTRLADIAQSGPYMILMLQHFGILMPLHDLTVAEACESLGIDQDALRVCAGIYGGQHEIPPPALQLKMLPTILDYLRNSHRYYLDEIYPAILDTIIRMKSTNHQREVQLVEKFFRDYFNEVESHIRYENDIVFPYAASLIEGQKEPLKPDDPSAFCATEYRDHHDDIREKLSDLYNLLLRFLPFGNDQAIRRRLLFMLAELSYDLTMHSLIEDLVLIPLLLQMEGSLNGQT